MTKKDKVIERPDGVEDNIAVGSDADGKIETLSPEEYAKRVAQRNADEADGID